MCCFLCAVGAGPVLRAHVAPAHTAPLLDLSLTKKYDAPADGGNAGDAAAEGDTPQQSTTNSKARRKRLSDKRAAASTAEVCRG